MFAKIEEEHECRSPHMNIYRIYDLDGRYMICTCSDRYEIPCCPAIIVDSHGNKLRDVLSREEREDLLTDDKIIYNDSGLCKRMLNRWIGESGRK